MARELHRLIRPQIQHLLEPLPHTLQPLAARLRGIAPCALALGRIARRARPQAHAPEALADVDHQAHDLLVVLVLELLADARQHHVEPGLVVGFAAAFEGVGPAAAGLVLRVFPFRAHAGLEEVVVGFLGELGGGGDVVLRSHERQLDVTFIVA